MDDLTPQVDNVIAASELIADKAANAADAFGLYVAVVRGSRNDDATNIGDMIADLLHLATLRGCDPDRILTDAVSHFECERRGEL